MVEYLAQQLGGWFSGLGVFSYITLRSVLAALTGLVLSLEAGLFNPGAFSFQVECSFLVTEGGGEPLAPQDRTHPIVPELP